MAKIQPIIFGCICAGLSPNNIEIFQYVVYLTLQNENFTPILTTL